MTGATLTDRYVAAAMRTVPEKQRVDLGTELRASIDDQVDARIEAGELPNAAERAVLTELGDPDVLAASYTDRPLQLLGSRYYLDWWRLLKLLLWIVLPCAAFGVALGQVLAGKAIGEVIGTTIVTMLMVTVHLCFWTTVVFVIIERTGVDRKGFTEWTVDQLPEPRPRGVGFGDMIGSLVFLALAAGAIIWDQTIGFVPAYAGIETPLPFLNPGLWPWWIMGLFVLMLLEAALAVVVYRVGRWTIALAVANAVLAVAVAIPALWLNAQGLLINPEFFPTVIPENSVQTVTMVLTVLTGFGIAAIALWDIIDVTIKTVRSRR